MKNLYFLLFIFTIFFSDVLYGQTGTFKIQGSIKENYEGEIVRIDLVKKGGSYETFFGSIKDHLFVVEIPECNTCDTLAKFRIGNETDEDLPIWLDGEYARIDSENGKMRISGTVFNDRYQQYMDTVEIYKNKAEEFYKNKIEQSGNASKQQVNEPNEWALKLGRYHYSFMKDNIRNPIGIYLFKEKLGFGIPVRLYDKTAFLEIYNAADDRIKSDVVASVKKIDIENAIDLYMKQMELTNSSAKDFGVKYIDERADKLLNVIANSKAEYFILDFWASWCGPCIAAIPDLLYIYERYNKMGLEIITVSIDENLSLWKSRLKKLNMPWINLIIDPNQTERKKVFEDYSFTGVPHVVLLDKSGKIISFLSAGKKSKEAQIAPLFLGK